MPMAMAMVLCLAEQSNSRLKQTMTSTPRHSYKSTRIAMVGIPSFLPNHH